MFPDWMQLVLLLLFAELAVPLVQASVFTYPTKGVQLTPGKPYNIAWKSVISAVLDSNTVATSVTADTSASRDDVAASSSVASVANRAAFRFRRRDDGQPGSYPISNSTSTPAGGTTTTMSTTYPAGISSTSDGAGSALPSSTGATSSSSQCIDGMPADTNGNVGLTERCSELLLVLEEDCTTMAPMAFNFNVSAGMIQLTIPFVGSSDQYRFSLAIADGGGQDMSLDLSYFRSCRAGQDSEIRRERK